LSLPQGDGTCWSLTGIQRARFVDRVPESRPPFLRLIVEQMQFLTEELEAVGRAVRPAAPAAGVPAPLTAGAQSLGDAAGWRDAWDRKVSAIDAREVQRRPRCIGALVAQREFFDRVVTR
jgi:hypothetical protein